jgi:hypothetical protein
MPLSCKARSASREFDWETRFYQCLSLHHVDLASRASEAEGLVYQRLSDSHAVAITPAEREALDDAIHHLRLIQVQHLGYPATDGELRRKPFPLPERSKLDQPSRDLTGRPKPLSELRNLWKAHAE